ncbi:hypothetical protein MESS4_560021 [Mesorhizobium sp. STM 4661]|nr:hypothetical protein MESS4_560021 [Mesorhizobium sp. STM 4661]
MRGVQFDEVEARAFGAPGRIGEAFDDLHDLVVLQRPRHLPARVVGNCRGRHDRPRVLIRLQRSAAFPRFLVGGLAAGMGKLGTEFRAGGGDALGGVQGAPGGSLVVVGIKTKAAMRDAAAPLDVGHLDRDHAGAGHGEIHPVIQVPVAGGAVIGGILAHRRDRYAVRESKAIKRDRLEKRCGHQNELREGRRYLGNGSRLRQTRGGETCSGPIAVRIAQKPVRG